MRILIIVLALCWSQEKDEWPAGGVRDGVELSIKSDKTEYAPTDDIELSVRLRNTSDVEKKLLFHHEFAKSIFVYQGESDLKIRGAGCKCGAYEAGAVPFTLKPGESKTCVVKAPLLGNKGKDTIRVHGGNIWPLERFWSNKLEITIK